MGNINKLLSFQSGDLWHAIIWKLNALITLVACISSRLSEHSLPEIMMLFKTVVPTCFTFYVFVTFFLRF